MMKELVEKYELYNFDQLKEIAAGNDEFLISLAVIFLKTTPADSAEMVNAAENGDWQKVSKYAHKIKSTVDGMNMTPIKNDIRTLEIDAKNKNNIATLTPLAFKIDNIIKEVARLVKIEFGL